MSVTKSYVRGIQEALFRSKMAFVLWLTNAAFAAVVYALASTILTSAFARSLVADDLLLGRLNVDAWIELLTGSGGEISLLVTAVFILLVLQVFVWPFLYGGILNELVRPRSAERFAPSFWEGGGRYYGRFLRLTAASVVLWVPAWAFFVVTSRALDAASADPLLEQRNFHLTLVRIAIGLFLVFLVKMILDYARIRIAASESRSVLGALAWAAGFVVRKLPRTLLLYYALGLTALAGFLVYLGIDALLNKTTSLTIGLGWLLIQFHILWRSWIKVAYQTAQLKFYTEASF